MQVLLVLDSLAAGGAERSTADALPRLGAHGIEPHLAVLHRRTGGFHDAVERAGHPVRVLEGPAPAALRRLTRELDADLVHTTLFAATTAARLGLVGSGVPLLTSLVSTSYEPERLADPNLDRLRLTAVKWFDRAGTRLTTHFHAITETVKRSAMRHLGIADDRITVIERGRDPETLGAPSPERRRAARAMLGLTEDVPLVVTVGRHEHAKGHPTLLAAAARLATSHPRLVTLIVGREGKATDDLRRRHDELRLGERVRFLGHRDDVPEILAAADVFVFPSRFEGLGGAVIEAMALGLPVVASDISAMREVTEPGGNSTLAPPDDGDALAAALAELLADAARRDVYGRRSRQIFLDRFTLDQSVARTAALYRSVVAAGR